MVAEVALDQSSACSLGSESVRGSSAKQTVAKTKRAKKIVLKNRIDANLENMATHKTP
jgi:hypothetical protein